MNPLRFVLAALLLFQFTDPDAVRTLQCRFRPFQPAECWQPDKAGVKFAAWKPDEAEVGKPVVKTSLMVRQPIEDGLIEARPMLAVSFGLRADNAATLKPGELLQCKVRPKTTLVVDKDAKGYAVTETVLDCNAGQFKLEKILFAPE